MHNKHFLSVNPVVVLLINMVAPTMYIFTKASFLQFFLLGFATVLLALMGYFRRMFVLLGIYAVFYGIFEACTAVGYYSGWMSYLIITIEFVPCLTLASVLVSKYSSSELLSALEGVHLPRTVVVATTITLKYIPTFRREFGYIKESMRLRGIPFSIRNPIRSFKFFIVPQLFRCAALTEEVTAAGLVKGINAPMRRSSYYSQKFRLSDSMILAVFAGGLMLGFVF